MNRGERNEGGRINERGRERRGINKQKRKRMKTIRWVGQMKEEENEIQRKGEREQEVEERQRDAKRREGRKGKWMTGKTRVEVEQEWWKGKKKIRKVLEIKKKENHKKIPEIYTKKYTVMHTKTPINKCSCTHLYIYTHTNSYTHTNTKLHTQTHKIVY